MRTRRTKEQIRKDNYNKDVDAYNFYVVNLDTKRAETGFEFKEDAVDVLNDYDDKKKYKVVSKRALKSMGIENPNESFKYEGGGDFQSGVYAKGGGTSLPEGALQKYFKDYPKCKELSLQIEEILGYKQTDKVASKIIKLADTYTYESPNKYANGGSLIGNQKRIDLNKNGKIDAEDFKLLRTTMNGGWRKDHKYVNSSNPKEDYEVIYARKYKPSRKGYKGKTNFATGGGVEKLSFEDWLKKNNIEVYKRTYYWVADDGGNDYMYSGSKSDVMKSLREDYKKSFATGGGISKFKMLSDKVARNYEGKRVKPQYQKEYGKVYSKSEAKEVGDKVAGKVKSMQKMATGGEVGDKILALINPRRGTDGSIVEVKILQIYSPTEIKVLYKSTQFIAYRESWNMSNSDHIRKGDWKIHDETYKGGGKVANGGETKKGGKGAIMILAKKIRKDGEKWTDAVKRAGQQLK